MAPVVRELEKHPGEIVSRVCITAQHREMLDQVLDLFEIVPDYDLDLMRDNESLCAIAARVFTELDPVVGQARPDWVLVLGDTTTVDHPGGPAKVLLTAKDVPGHAGSLEAEKEVT